MRAREAEWPKGEKVKAYIRAQKWRDLRDILLAGVGFIVLAVGFMWFYGLVR